MSSLPDMDWGPPTAGTGASTPLYGFHGGGSRSIASLAMDGERIVEEIDRVMMQTHSIRGKILKQTVRGFIARHRSPCRATIRGLSGGAKISFLFTRCR